MKIDRATKTYEHLLARLLSQMHKRLFHGFLSEEKLSIDLHMTAEQGNIRQTPVLD
jgi:hypothetical protein